MCGLGLSKYAPFTYIILLLSVYMVAISAKIYIEQEIGDKENVINCIIISWWNKAENSLDSLKYYSLLKQ